MPSSPSASPNESVSAGGAGLPPLTRARLQRAARLQVRPGWLSRNFVARPKCSCAVVALVPVLALAAVVFTRSFALADPGYRDYLIFSSERVQVDDARAASYDETVVDDLEAFVSGAEQGEKKVVEVPRSARRNALQVQAIWRQGGSSVDDVVDKTVDAAKGENMLTRENVAMMKRLEDEFRANDEYAYYCWYDEDTLGCDGKVPECAFPKSITAHPLLYGVLNENGTLCGVKEGSEVVNQEQFDRFLAAIVEPAVEGNGVRAIVKDIRPYLGADANVTETPTTFVTRSVFEFGLPFNVPSKDFPSEDEDRSEQRALYTDWLKLLVPKLEDSARTASKPLNLIMNGTVYSNSVFGQQATKDLAFAIVAIVLVMLFMWLHTGSLFLAATSMFQVILAFPLAYFVYRLIFRIAYFSSLQIMTIFLILGIAADDAFVFVDAWKQSAVVLGANCDLERRMSWTYHRAVKAMAVTSFTTALAFGFTAVSPVMPVGTLGYWAALLVLVQYALIIFMFPCAVIMWHRSFRPRSIKNCFKRPADAEGPALITIEDDEQNLESLENSDSSAEAEREAAVHSEDVEDAVVGAHGDGGEKKSFWKRIFAPKDENEYRIVERFFRYRWSVWVNKLRYPLFAFALVLFGVSVYFATRLEPLTQEESFLPDTHPLLVSTQLIRDAFPSADGQYNVVAILFWGVLGVDRSSVSRYDPEEIGKAVYDDSFDLKPAAAQQHLLDACASITSNRDLLPLYLVDESDCWIRDFQLWRSLTNETTEFETYGSDGELATDLRSFFSYRNATSGQTPFFKYARNQRIQFSPDGNRERVVYTELRFRTDVKQEEPASVIWPLYEDWQEQTDKLAAEAPASMSKPLVTGGYAFMWAVTTTTLIRNAFVGLGIMLGVAFVVLALSTANIIVAAIALCAIGGIVTNLLALINLWKFEMGLTESVSVIIAAGVSFDFASHLANAYTESKSQTRFHRVRDALTDLGISVLAGGISTILSAATLLYACLHTLYVPLLSARSFVAPILTS